MQTGNKLIPEWNEDEFKKFEAIVDYSIYKKIISYLNKEISSRDVILRLFFYPDVARISESLSLPPKAVIETMFFINSYFPSLLKLEAFFQKDDEQIFEKLQEEDFEFLNKDNVFYNPRNPSIYYTNASQFIRHAFSMGGQ